MSVPTSYTNTRSDNLPFKTELCNKFSETGFCRYGMKCRFAHGNHELRDDVRKSGIKKYKSEYCRNYHSEKTTCPYGKRCHFIHDETPEQIAQWRCVPCSPHTMMETCIEASKMEDHTSTFVSVGPSPSWSPPQHLQQQPLTTGAAPAPPIALGRSDSWYGIAADACNFVGKSIDSLSRLVVEQELSTCPSPVIGSELSVKSKPFMPSSPPLLPTLESYYNTHTTTQPRMLSKRLSFFESVAPQDVTSRTA